MVHPGEDRGIGGRRGSERGRKSITATTKNLVLVIFFPSPGTFALYGVFLFGFLSQ